MELTDDVLRRAASELSNDRLISGVLANLRPRRRCFMWGEVTRVFGIGSTSANWLCRKYGYDPDQQISNFKRPSRTLEPKR